MTWSYDPTTDLGKTRLLAHEKVQGKSVLADEDIQALLDMQGGSIRLAAADALDHIADDQDLLLKKVTLGGGALVTDGPAVAAELRKHAVILRAQEFDLEDPEGAFDWAEMALTPAGAREILTRDLLR